MQTAISVVRKHPVQHSMRRLAIDAAASHARKQNTQLASNQIPLGNRSSFPAHSSRKLATALVHGPYLQSAGRYEHRWCAGLHVYLPCVVYMYECVCVRVLARVCVGKEGGGIHEEMRYWYSYAVPVRCHTADTLCFSPLFMLVCVCVS